MLASGLVIRCSWTLLCGLVVLLVLSGVEWFQPKRSRPTFMLLLGVWFYMTTAWVSETKALLVEFGGGVLRPSTVYWLTLVPLVLSTCSMLFLAKVKSYNTSQIGPSMHCLTQGEAAWHAAGAAYFSGQLLTITALSWSNPAVVFVVKALEPLSTALLALPTLDQPFRPSLFVGVCVSCAGIVLVVLGHPASDEPHPASDDYSRYPAAIAALFTILANLGYSVRGCTVKKAYISGHQPLEVFTRTSVTGTIAGLLPLLCFAVSHAPAHVVKELMGVGRAMMDAPGVWLNVSMCFCLYQISSILVLEVIAVESHALLVASKQMFVVMVATVFALTAPTPMTIVGFIVACCGVLFYSRHAATEKNSQATTQEGKPILPSLVASGGVGSLEVPPLLQGITLGLMGVSCLVTLSVY